MFDREQCIREIDFELFLVKKTIFTEIVKSIGQELSMSHFYLLKFIDFTKNCIVSDIAQHLDITLSGVSQLVEKLVNMGLVTRERSQEDRRIVYVKITDQGRKMLDKLNQNKLKIFQKYLSILDETELQNFSDIMKKISSNVLKEDINK